MLLSRLGLLARLLDDDHGHRESDLHDVVDQDLDVVDTGDGKLDAGENTDEGGGLGRVGQGEFRIALAQHLLAIGGHDPDLLGELADAGAPAVHHADLWCGDRDLRDPDDAQDAHEDEVTGGFLSDIFDQE